MMALASTSSHHHTTISTCPLLAYVSPPPRLATLTRCASQRRFHKLPLPFSPPPCSLRSINLSEANDDNIEDDLNFLIQPFEDQVDTIREEQKRQFPPPETTAHGDADQQQRHQQEPRQPLFSSPHPHRRRPRRPKSAINNSRNKKNESYQVLSNSIDSFLAGDSAHPFSPDAPVPHPGLGPGETVDISLRALRRLDDPYTCHGAAVFLQFCIPLTRGERWGGNIPPTATIRSSKNGNFRKRSSSHQLQNKWPGYDPWKELLRGAITPAMLARKLRASSQFSALLDWTSLDVTEGASNPNPSAYYISGRPDSDVAYVNAGLFFGQGLAPTIIHFVMKNIGDVWFIDTVLVGSDQNNEDWLLVGGGGDEDEDDTDNFTNFGLL